MNDWCLLLDGRTLPGKEEVGGKAASLARMRHLGLSVPPAFVLPTQVSHAPEVQSGTLPEQAIAALQEGMAYLESQTGRTFGSGERPLLVSVRSGAPVSMPGMMDTVLNLGINEDVEAALAAQTGDAAYATDTHQRFVIGYGRIVLKADLDDEGGSVADLKQRVRDETGSTVPDEPMRQLQEAVLAVLASWNSRRAKAYRKHTGISDQLGTAVTVQAMVFGNADEHSGTGVLFTRDPATGASAPFGEYLPGGQGEDVVSGERTPFPLAVLQEQLPQLHDELIRAGALLEREGRDVQDIEFTVEGGRLYLLQSRAAKRSPEAAVRLAVAFAREGVITQAEALARVTSEQVRQLLTPRLAESVREQAVSVAHGDPVCSGVIAGVALADADEVLARAALGESVIFIAKTTSPEDVQAMIAADAVCTETGGSTSHAAVVCRGLGRPAVVGCGPGVVQALTGRPVTLDGATGFVYDGLLALQEVRASEDGDLSTLQEWAAESAPLTVIPHAEAPADTIDLDALSVVDATEVAAAVTSAMVAKGVVLETDAGVAAALEGGVAAIVSDEPLPILLAALALAPQGRPLVSSDAIGIAKGS